MAFPALPMGSFQVGSQLLWERLSHSQSSIISSWRRGNLLHIDQVQNWYWSIQETSCSNVLKVYKVCVGEGRSINSFQRSAPCAKHAQHIASDFTLNLTRPQRELLHSYKPVHRSEETPVSGVKWAETDGICPDDRDTAVCTVCTVHGVPEWEEAHLPFLISFSL